jgi:hypothetical protein
MKPVTVIVALVVAGLVLAGAVILSASGPRAAARTPQGSAATGGGNGCTATTPSSMVMPASAVAGGPPAGRALRGRIDALTPPVRPPAAYRAALATPAAGCTTAGGQAWDPGNIISDKVFYNTSSMTVEQISDSRMSHRPSRSSRRDRLRRGSFARAGGGQYREINSSSAPRVNTVIEVSETISCRARL